MTEKRYLSRTLEQLDGQRWAAPDGPTALIDDVQMAPLAGDLYAGDLLGAVLHAAGDYWSNRPDELMRLWSVREALEHLHADTGRLLKDERWPAFG